MPAGARAPPKSTSRRLRRAPGPRAAASSGGLGVAGGPRPTVLSGLRQGSAAAPVVPERGIGGLGGGGLRGTGRALERLDVGVGLAEPSARRGERGVWPVVAAGPCARRYRPAPVGGHGERALDAVRRPNTAASASIAGAPAGADPVAAARAGRSDRVLSRRQPGCSGPSPRAGAGASWTDAGAGPAPGSRRARGVAPLPRRGRGASGVTSSAAVCSVIAADAPGRMRAAMGERGPSACRRSGEVGVPERWARVAADERRRRAGSPGPERRRACRRR